MADATTWVGELPATQDYGIKAVTVGGDTPYTLQGIVEQSWGKN